MKKIQWTPKGSRTHATTKVGCVCLQCIMFWTRTDMPRWYARISIDGMVFSSRQGKERHSLRKAKEDAERMARELLSDIRESVTRDLELYGVEA